MHGGYRVGSGRKKGVAAKNAEEARTLLSEMVLNELRPIAEALITKAKTGDVSATKELFDRAFGKPLSHITDINNDYIPIPILPLIRDVEMGNAAIEKYLKSKNPQNI